jgi:predicted outer membrane repeat protein
VSGNASGDGGGLFAWRGNVSLRNSTVSGNSATAQGGGIATYQLDSLDLVQSTITANTAPVGAGIRLYSRPALGTPVTALGSLLAGNIGSPDIEHAGGADDAITGDHNLIGTISAHIAYPSDTLSCDPHLRALAGNGGPTATHGLAEDSCARDAGGLIAWSAYDQRGEGHPRLVGDAVDIGAYEYDPADLDRLFIDGFD